MYGGKFMLRIGIIGFGYMGHFHLDRIRKTGKADVVAIMDIRPEKIEQAKEEGIKGFFDLNEFLKVEMDLVVICTPNNWHSIYSIKALKAGKHVMCEKPATLSALELKQVMKCAYTNGKIFTVHQNRRWDVDYKVVYDVVNKRTIGRISTIESRVLGERGVCYGWRGDPEAGGGMLYDWGVHLIDQMLQLFPSEKVTSVYARMNSILTPSVDDYFDLQIMFSNDVCAHITVGTFALQKLPRWFVFGDRGTLKLDDFSGKNGGITRIRGEVRGFDSVLGKKNLGPSRTMAPLEKDQLEEIELTVQDSEELTYWNNLVASVEGKEIPYVQPKDVLRQMKIVEAAFLSSKDNRVIKTYI